MLRFTSNELLTDFLFYSNTKYNCEDNDPFNLLWLVPNSQKSFFPILITPRTYVVSNQKSRHRIFFLAVMSFIHENPTQVSRERETAGDPAWGPLLLCCPKSVQQRPTFQLHTPGPLSMSGAGSTQQDCVRNLMIVLLLFLPRSFQLRLWDEAASPVPLGDLCLHLIFTALSARSGGGDLHILSCWGH